MTVIDLGRVGHDDDDPPAAFRPRKLRRHEWRRLLLVVVAVGSVLTVTGSARPDPRGLVQLWDVPFTSGTGSYQLSGDNVYVLDRSGGRQLTAHDARTGAVRWSAPAGDSTGLAGVGAGALLIRADPTVISREGPDGSSSVRELSRDTVAVDPATGRQLWRQPGETMTVLDDHALLVEWDGTGERARRIRLVQSRDGAVVWSRDGSNAVSWTIDPTPGVRADRLLTVTAQGRAEVIALADGSVVTTGTLPRSGESMFLTMTGGQLYQDRTVDGRTTITAYDVDTLSRQWTVEQPSGGSFGCGPVVCIGDGEAVYGHDRTTGARLWRLSGISNVYPLTGGRLLIRAEQGAWHSVVEGTSGRRVAELGRGLPVWDPRGRLAYLIADTRQPPGLTSVSSFDPASTEVVLRGTVASAQICRTDRGLLTCVTQDNRLAVTDVG